MEIVIMTIYSIIAGCDVWEDIVDFCRVKETWFKESLHLKLKNGLPSHDTMQRVWSMIDPSEFERCFRKWVSSVCGEEEGEIISIDGKPLQRSGSREQSPVHMVSAWANRKQLVLGQYAVEEKSNEITAVPALLEMLDIENCVITADAMSCQKEIAKKLIDKKDDYVIGLKDNQPNLRRDAAAEYFADAWRDPRNYPAIQTIKTVEKGHGAGGAAKILSGRGPGLAQRKGSVERTKGLWGGVRNRADRRTYNRGNTLLHHISG